MSHAKNAIGLLGGLLAFGVTVLPSASIAGEKAAALPAASRNDRLRQHDDCVKLRRELGPVEASKIPGCEPQVSDATTESAPKSGTSVPPLTLCRDQRDRCECLPNGIDRRCKFDICGYQRGHYSDGGLPELASRIADEVALWSSSDFVLVRFVGFADGVAWLSENGRLKPPQPESIPAGVALCERRATQEAAAAVAKLSQADLADARLAILRGCMFEQVMRERLPKFELDSVPKFSFERRKVGVDDPTARAAELEIVVANSCGG